MPRLPKETTLRSSQSSSTPQLHYFWTVAPPDRTYLILPLSPFSLEPVLSFVPGHHGRISRRCPSQGQLRQKCARPATYRHSSDHCSRSCFQSTVQCHSYVFRRLFLPNFPLEGMLTVFFYSRFRKYHPRMYVYNRTCLQLRTSDSHATLTLTLEWHADAKLSSRSLVQFPRN